MTSAALLVGIGLIEIILVGLLAAILIDEWHASSQPH